MRFYGYKHWTLEKVPRCFYVGKGLKRRPFDERRNRKWHRVVKRYGLHVEVCVGPITNDEAIEWEVANIVAEDTYTQIFSTEDGSNIRCNFTRGGEGSTGHRMPVSSRQRVGRAQRGKQKSIVTRQKLRAALVGRRLSTTTRKKMSDAKRGKPLSKENRSNLWANRSRVFSEKHRNNLSIAAKQRKCSLCKTAGHKRTSCHLLEKETCHE